MYPHPYIVLYFIYFYSLLDYIRIGSTPVIFFVHEHKLKYMHKYTQKRDGGFLLQNSDDFTSRCLVRYLATSP